MRITTLSLLLPGLVHGAVVSFERRQEEAALADSIPSRKAYSISELPPLTKYPGAKRIKMVYGPFKVRGAKDPNTIPGTSPSMDKGGTAYNFHLDTDFPRDITLLIAESDLTTKDGKVVTLEDKVYNHHTTFLEAVPLSDQIYSCESGKPAKQPPPIYMFGGTATEKVNFNFTINDPNIKTGFYIGKNAKLQNMVDLVNYGETAEYYSTNTFEFIPGKPAGYLFSKHTFLDPATCGGADGFKIPEHKEKKFTIEAGGIIMKESGYITEARGHLHDGGMAMTLEVNDKLVCTSTALYGGDGYTFKDDKGKSYDTIAKSTLCRNPIKLMKGDKLKLTASYDLDKHASRPMGAAPGAMAGHGNMKTLNSVLDNGEAEQMGLMYINFAQL